MLLNNNLLLVQTTKIKHELLINFVKELPRRKFWEWFANQIAAQLEDDTQQVNIQQVDMRLGIMKPLSAC